MRFDQLPLGAKVTMGRKVHPGYGSRVIPLTWHKVAPEKLLAETPLRQDILCVDTDAEVMNFYPESPLHKRLQDISSYFNEEEYNCLEPFTIRCAVPQPLRRQYGTIWPMQVMAALPSLSELIDLDKLSYTPASLVREEQPFFPENNRPNTLLYLGYLTRTPSGNKSYRYAYGYSQFNNHKASKWAAVKPVISIAGSTEFIFDDDRMVWVLADPDIVLNIDEEKFSSLL